MKVKVSKEELRECVENAMLRLVKEGKSLRKFKDNEDRFGCKQPKHAKLNGKGGDRKPKGGANSKRWENSWDED